MGRIVMSTGKEEIKRMVYEANQLQKKGKHKEALEQLNRAFDEINILPEAEMQQYLLGLTWHYRGSTLQRMGEYNKAVEAIEMAIAFRDNNPIERAYSVFQLFICKEYGNISISDEDVRETKIALIAAMANKAASIQDIGNMMQNVAYVEQVKGDIEKAILFYKMTLDARREAQDERGLALTEARLAEEYWKMDGRGDLAMSFGRRALGYFERTGDIERIKQVKVIFGWE